MTTKTERPTSKRSISLSRPLILEATANCLSQEGYDGTTIRKIATMLDCAVGSIYRYFDDKRELLAAVTQQRFELATAVLESGGSIGQCVESYIDAALAAPEAYRLMFWLSSVGHMEAASAPLPAVVQQIIDGWTRRGVGGGLAQRTWAMLHGLIMLGRPRTELQDAARRIVAAERTIAATRPPATRPVAPGPAPASVATPAPVIATSLDGSTAAAAAAAGAEDVCLL